MADYIRPPIEVDPDDVRLQMIADLQARIPGWQPNLGALDTAMLEVDALQIATLREVASAVFDSIYRYAGASLYAILPNDATRATASSTWTTIDTAGYTIPAGTEVRVNTAGDAGVGFQVVDDVVVPPGSAATAAGGVQLEALVAGVEGSGLTGTVDLVTPLDGVASISLVGQTVGGRDAEEDEEYLDRLTRRLRRLTFGLVLPDDVAEACVEIPGVERVLVIDNYIPAGPGGSPPAQTNAAAALTVVAIDAAGAAVGSAVKSAIVAELEAGREQGFQFSVMNATTTDIVVTFTFTTYPGFEPASVKAAAEAAVTAYLSPANWGRPAFGDARSVPGQWVEDTTVRFGELYAVLNAVQGLDHVTALAINGNPDANAALTGPGALPHLTSVTGTPA